MKCPHCGKTINIGALLGSISTPRKTAAARRNAKLGGWPKGRKRKKLNVPNAGGQVRESGERCPAPTGSRPKERKL
jgi:hypothetical protein